MSIRCRIGIGLFCIVLCSFTAGINAMTGDAWLFVINAMAVAINVSNMPIPSEEAEHNLGD